MNSEMKFGGIVMIELKRIKIKIYLKSMISERKFGGAVLKLKRINIIYSIKDEQNLHQKYKLVSHVIKNI